MSFYNLNPMKFCLVSKTSQEDSLAVLKVNSLVLIGRKIFLKADMQIE
jgi:hypothetical protein